MGKSNKDIIINFRVTEQLNNLLMKRARKNNRTKSWELVDILESLLIKNEDLLS